MIAETAPLVQSLGFDGFGLDIMRLDLIHPVTGGNKVFKLRHHLGAALAGNKCVLTFGGANSNHIAAVAQACSEKGLDCIGVVRGADMPTTTTIGLARTLGMKILPVSKDQYSRRHDPDFISDLNERFGDFYLIPEGGAGAEGVHGCSEILPQRMAYDYVICAAGTGTTVAGLVLSHGSVSHIIGVSALKGGNSVKNEVNGWLERLGCGHTVCGDESLATAELRSHCILDSYAFSGFAKFDEEPESFRRWFEARTGILLDHIYNSKSFYAAFHLYETGRIPRGSRVLMVHTGGLQGNADFRQRYARKFDDTTGAITSRFFAGGRQTDYL